MAKLNQIAPILEVKSVVASEAFYRETRLMRLLYGREGELDRARGERFISAE